MAARVRRRFPGPAGRRPLGEPEWGIGDGEPGSESRERVAESEGRAESLVLSPVSSGPGPSRTPPGSRLCARASRSCRRLPARLLPAWPRWDLEGPCGDVIVPDNTASVLGPHARESRFIISASPCALVTPRVSSWTLQRGGGLRWECSDTTCCRGLPVEELKGWGGVRKAADRLLTIIFWQQRCAGHSARPWDGPRQTRKENVLEKSSQRCREDRHTDMIATLCYIPSAVGLAPGQ